MILKSESSFLKELYLHSVKYILVVFHMMIRRGPVLVSSQFRSLEGLETLAIYLRFFGFRGLNDDFREENTDSDMYQFATKVWGYIPKFAFYSGDQDLKERSKVISTNNDPLNVDGS